jgi:glycerophosphoryl diester phosphodiesterase
MEVLQSIKVNVEIKVAPSPTRPSVDESATIVRDVLDLLHSVDQIPSVIISCFDLLTCTQVRDYDTDVNVAWLMWDVLLDVALTKAHILGLNAVNPYFSLVTPETFEQSVDLGLELNVWTVNKESDMIALSALGVASIITDLPAKALSLLS